MPAQTSTQTSLREILEPAEKRARKENIHEVANKRVQQISCSAHTLDADAIKKQYTEWVETGDYDKEMVEGLGYTVPAKMDKYIGEYCPKNPSDAVLDAGCGTGLVGVVLAAKGCRNIIGCDLTPAMLNVAKATKAYAELDEADLAEPLKYKDGTFQLVTCGGVLTWIECAQLVMDEFLRVTAKGGYICFTHRSDTLVKFGYEQVQEKLAASGKWKGVMRTDAIPYLPGQETFKDNLLVTHFIYQKL